MPPAPDRVPPGSVAIGRILTTWGLRGDLKVEPLAPPDTLYAGRTVQVRGDEYTIERHRIAGRFHYVKFAGIETPEAAAQLRGAYLQVREADLPPLPEGEYYRYQLIGLAVSSTAGEEIGRITDVISTPQSDVFVVTGPRGEVLIPATEDVVQAVDLAADALTVELIPGLLPEGREPRTKNRGPKRRRRRLQPPTSNL